MKYLYGLFLVLTSMVTSAQSISLEDMYSKTSFVIIMSSKNYDAAKKVAIQASSKLNLKLDLRDLKPNKQIGLTYTAKECDDNGWSHPCYVSRGRSDGEFVTIDYSNAFDGFAKGYYIVTTASGDAPMIKRALQKAKSVYTTAYVKQTKVYIGCMH